MSDSLLAGARGQLQLLGALHQELLPIVDSLAQRDLLGLSVHVAVGIDL